MEKSYLEDAGEGIHDVCRGWGESNVVGKGFGLNGKVDTVSWRRSCDNWCS